jgi:hypothetical protein
MPSSRVCPNLSLAAEGLFAELLGLNPTNSVNRVPCGADHGGVQWQDQYQPEYDASGALISQVCHADVHPSCGKRLPLTKFTLKSSSPTGYRPRCVDCCRPAANAHYQANKVECSGRRRLAKTRRTLILPCT